MSAPCYIAWNATTTGLSSPEGGTSVSTLSTALYVTPGTPKIRVIEWGYSFTTVPTAVVTSELIVTSGSPTAGTSITPSKYNDVTGSAAQSSAHLVSAEGTPGTTRLLAFQYEWGQSFKQQFPLGREPEVNSGEYLRLRFGSSTSITVVSYVIWEE